MTSSLSQADVDEDSMGEEREEKLNLWCEDEYLTEDTRLKVFIVTPSS